MSSELETQRKRLAKSERDVAEHIFERIATAANNAMKGSSLEADVLRAALVSTRREGSMNNDAPLTAEELTKFAKSGVVMNRKRRKMKDGNPKNKVNTAALMEQIESLESYQDDSWDDMLALTDVLEAFGCLTRVSDSVDVDSDNENDRESVMYDVTQAGINIGMLGFENSLWCLVAIGGAWDVANASYQLDEFRSSWEDFNDEYLVDAINEDDISQNAADSQQKKDKNNKMPKPQQEAESLLSLLCSLSPSELAGYVSCLVSEGSRSSASIVESFQTLSPTMQQVVQSTLSSMERLLEVQKKCSVDESSVKCQLELGTFEVVAEWASGCSWNEALEISGSAPGDLIRTLNRALDALRQLGNLPYVPIRGTDLDGVTVHETSRGIHPIIRKMCREAAIAMDRYPVKDPLLFDSEEGEDTSENDDEEQDISDDLINSEEIVYTEEEQSKPYEKSSE
uniref:ATP-dependent RNA helicase Ski2/MTR4 C-terminal domain-containing protein n=1 Tax=Ditylum brightwellii TaxID=49249 RepID=A0A6U3RH20_9STRA